MMWNIAIYLRLSKEDGDKDESDSIFSQRILVSNFISKNIPEGKIVGEFVDDGFTGTNFKRPQFQRMIELVEEKKINCIIVKDLSRFGRDYIGVGEYLEKYFPLNDIRFIAINDGYDTTNANSNDEFIMPIKNIFNAQYSKDISKKVKGSFRALQGEGKFVGAFASYGYVKDEKDRHRLKIDEPAAIIVRKIFELYNSGHGKISIARMLNEENVPCPSEYKRLNGLNYTNGQKMELTKYWTYSTIHNILRNELYIGNMVQNKSITKTVRGKSKKNNKENWICVKNTHDPIIPIDVWNTTQTLLKKNTRQLDFEQNVGIFAGYIFCGNCGRAMTKVTNKYKGRVTTTYICGSYKRYGESTCKRNAVKLDVLEKLVLDKLNEQIKKAGEIKYFKEAKNPQEADLKKYKIELERLDRLKMGLYEDYKDGLLTREEYVRYKTEYEQKEALARGQIDFINESSKSKNEEKNKWVEMLLKHRNIESLDRETVAEVLDRIIVTDINDTTNINIVFKFSLL